MNRYRIEGLTIREHLMNLKANSNKVFKANLHPGVENILGLAMPDLRALAQKIVDGDWRIFLLNADTFYVEERLLISIVVSNIKVRDVDEYLGYVDDFVKIINCWSVCDTFDFKGKKSFVKKNKQKIWDYLCHYMESDKEYEIRFGIIMGQKYYIDKDNIKLYLNKLASIHHDGYYVKMAIAWALCTCYIKFPGITATYLHEKKWDGDTLRKAIRKICDSFRVSPEGKEVAKELRVYIR